jgi:hypothetical protein
MKLLNSKKSALGFLSRQELFKEGGEVGLEEC